MWRSSRELPLLKCNKLPGWISSTPWSAFARLQSHDEKWCRKEEYYIMWLISTVFCRWACETEATGVVQHRRDFRPGRLFLLTLPTALKPPLSLLIKTLGNQHPSQSICPFWTRGLDVRIYHSYMLNDLGLPTYIQSYLMHAPRDILERENKLQINSEFRHKVSWSPL